MIIKHDDNIMLSREDFRRIASKVLDAERDDIPEGMATILQLLIITEATSTLHCMERKLFDEEESESENE